MTSKIKVDNITNQSDSNIVNKCGTTITLGASGDTINLASGASQTGFGRTGTVDWDTTAKTTSFTAVSGNGYFVNTTSGAITVTLPASPSAGDIVSLSDYTNTWQTNLVTVARNGSNIGGVAADAFLTTEGQSVTFVYVDATEGWKNVQDSTSNVTGNTFLQATGGTITTDGNFKIHTFTGPGTFTVSSIACCSSDNNVDYLVVAGGGGGGGVAGDSVAGGGGGAGGYRESPGTTTGSYTVSPLGVAPAVALPVSATGYPISVGGGGTGGGTGPVIPTSGSNSIFSSITSTGGGNGLSRKTEPGPNNTPAGTGGSGGGGTWTFPGATGNTPPVSPAQGTNGGNGTGPTNQSGAGGGGATSFGINAPGPAGPGGAGGAGATSSINGTPTARAGGGAGGGGYPGCNSGAAGGSGGGGASGPVQVNGSAGTTNTGGGGGAGGGDGPGSVASNTLGGNGGSGIVIIRYKFQ